MNKKNSYDYKKILILISLIIIFSLSFITNDIYTNKNGYFDNPNDDTIKELENNDLRSQGLTSDNFYDGIGAAWNLTHWANRTDNNLDVSFENNSYDIKNMPLDVGWQGYKLNATIKDLYDERNWVNGTFDCGTDDGWDSDDSDLVQNWTFGYTDIVGTYNNDFWGNYFDGVEDLNIDQTCLGLTLYGGNNPPTSYGYDKYDACWWNTSFTLPRGDVIAGEINFAIYPYTQYHPSSGPHDPDFGSHFSVRVTLNDVCIDDKNLIWLQDAAGGSGNWVSLKLQLTNWLDNKTVFPDGVKDMNLELKLLRVGATYSYMEYGVYQRVLFDNVSLSVKAEAKPEQIDLHINQTNYVNDIDWGEGIVEIVGNWNGTKYPWVHANFSSDEVWDLGSYDVDFKTDLNLFAIKHSPETNYETNAATLGTLFSVSNNSLVDWECYGYTSVPTGYAETEMKLEFPTDVNITWISYPSDPLTNKLDLDSCDNSTAGLLTVDVSEISVTPDGFWKFKALSPNYCEQLTIFNNATTGSWIEDTEFLSGEYINISAVITNNSLISDYIHATIATLQIRFPNGTIWSDKTQEQNPIANGSVYFDPILIPPTTPAYEVGEYDAIITWNNSHSTYGLNETGIIYKKFTVMHNSTLIPDQSYYADIFESTLINLKVSFNDLVDGKAIENALVYTYNFAQPSIMQNFSEISPGYYVLLDFNISGGNPGENNITIYANSFLYTNNEVNITIELILETTLTAEEYPSIQVPWNTNFTIHLNYTEKTSGNGIETTPTIYWNGDTHTKAAGGVYNITCNSSAYEVNKRHNLNIDFNETGHEPQLITIIIEVIQIETDLKLFLNGVDKTNEPSIDVNTLETLNITIKYTTYGTGVHISNATIELSGSGLSINISENLDLKQYSFIINTIDLNVGFNFLTVYAQKSNYEVQAILITIQLIERKAYDEIYLDNEDKTLEKSIETPIGKKLNITFKYFDDITGEHISQALVQLIGAEYTWNFTENNSLKQYSLIIDTTELDIGLKFLTIYAQRTYYQSSSELLEIIVRQIKTNITTISGEDVINIQAGESYTLRITLHDLDFGSIIKNATVRYTWELGQGYLTDDDNNGIFEGTLENIPEGTFTITFTILNVSDDYLFERKVITLNVISSPEETLLFQILTIVAIAAFISVTGYFIAYQRVLKYPKPVRKIHKFKKTLKKKKSPDVEILSSKVLLKALYNEELDPVAKLFKGKMKYEQPEKQLELKPSKDELIDTLSEISPEESEKNEK